MWALNEKVQIEKKNTNICIFSPDTKCLVLPLQRALICKEKFVLEP